MTLSSSMPFALIVILVLCLAPTANAKFIDRLSYDELSSVVGPSPALLLFTAGWCGHCKEMQPEIAVLAKAVKNNPGITVARIDADEEPAIVSKFSVQSFPTILYTPPGFSLKGIPEPEEFTDYRWAELMAEFVNNETKSATVQMNPREKFLKWRKKVPFNKGKQPRQKVVRKEAPTPHPDGLDPIIGAEDSDIVIRDPIVVDGAAHFDDVVVNNKTESFAVYFYTKDDPMQRDYLIQWRQAASAFQPTDHVALVMVNTEKADNKVIYERYAVPDTPAVLYFARCNTPVAKKEGYECKKPVSCGEGCGTTDEIITFVTDQMSAETGAPETGDDVLSLTEEEYKKLMEQDNIFPVDATEEEMQEKMKHLESVEEVEDPNPDETLKVEDAEVEPKTEL